MRTICSWATARTTIVKWLKIVLKILKAKMSFKLKTLCLNLTNELKKRENVMLFKWGSLKDVFNEKRCHEIIAYGYFVVVVVFVTVKVLHHDATRSRVKTEMTAILCPASLFYISAFDYNYEYFLMKTTE